MTGSIAGRIPMLVVKFAGDSPLLEPDIGAAAANSHFVLHSNRQRRTGLKLR